MLNLEAKVREYREYKRMIEEMQSLADGLADELKAALNEAGESKLIVGEYKLSYTDSKRETLDKKRLEADLGDLTDYTKVTYYKRQPVTKRKKAREMNAQKKGNYGKEGFVVRGKRKSDEKGCLILPLVL